MSKKRKYSKYDKKKYGWLHFAIEFVAGIAVFLLVVSFVVGVAKVDGVSMYPTLKNNQPVIYNRLENSYQYGDIVAIKMPSGSNYVKRVIGVAGDTIELKDGKVSVNGKIVDEPYATQPTEPENERVLYPLTVGEGELFVLGDNRPESVDSRDFGCVILENVKGKLLGKH